MQRFLILLLLAFPMSRNTDALKSTPNTIASNASENWVNSFKEFRNAVYQNDRVKVKQFVHFPIMNENNEIWYLVYGGNDKMISILSEKIKPFTELDFDKHYSRLFTKQFITAALKIKSEELYSKGSFDTPAFKDGDTKYKINANYEGDEITINLNSETPVRDEKGKMEDKSEFSTIYYFKVLKGGQIQFMQVRLAG